MQQFHVAQEPPLRLGADDFDHDGRAVRHPRAVRLVEQARLEWLLLEGRESLFGRAPDLAPEQVPHGRGRRRWRAIRDGGQFEAVARAQQVNARRHVEAEAREDRAEVFQGRAEPAAATLFVARRRARDAVRATRQPVGREALDDLIAPPLQRRTARRLF